MKRIATALFALMVVGTMIAAAPAMAQQVIGGHNETSQAMASPVWAAGPPTPGGVAGHAAAHLQITEIAVTPTPAEFIEIHNPTALAVDLTNYYLTDSWFAGAGGVIVSYASLPQAGGVTLGSNTDFIVRFPAGSSIPAGGTIVVAMYGPGIDSTYGGGTASYEVTSVSPGIPNMINASNTNVTANATTLTNGSEFVMLFYWDQLDEHVCDVDYVTWGPSTGTSRVDKTGYSVDGPDADAIATSYYPDTPIAAQTTAPAPGAGSSIQLAAGLEGAEGGPGNGCIPGLPTPTKSSTWGKVKTIYRN